MQCESPFKGLLNIWISIMHMLDTLSLINHFIFIYNCYIFIAKSTLELVCGEKQLKKKLYGIGTNVSVGDLNKRQKHIFFITSARNKKPLILFHVLWSVGSLTFDF